jgi:hypothetical protein
VSTPYSSNSILLRNLFQRCRPISPPAAIIYMHHTTVAAVNVALLVSHRDQTCKASGVFFESINSLAGYTCVPTTYWMHAQAILLGLEQCW